jgi:hypothetical protein
MALLSTFEAGHSGLPHVRTLCITPELTRHYYHREDDQIKTSCQILFAIPRDSLTKFEYGYKSDSKCSMEP